jgi:hypothetical protein
MKIRSGFLVTPIGEENSVERIHADRMKSKVFKPLEKELICQFERADTDPQSQIVAKSIYMGIKSSDIVIADTIGNNPNVLYEIGIAHAINKPVIIINPRNNVLPFDIHHFTYIPYNQEVFDGTENTDEVAMLQDKIKKQVYRLEKDSEDTLSDYLPSYSKIIKETDSKILEDINTRISYLMEAVTLSQNKARVITEYIEGQDRLSRH